LEVFTESPAATDAGTEIPVVHESDTRSDIIRLFPVSLSPRYRARLRVYDWDGLVDSHVLVRVIRTDRPELLAESVLTVRAEALRTRTGYPLAPGYGEWVNFPRFVPGILPDDATARVEIVPLTPNMRFWAFVSITSNETQRFSIVTPQ
jgi:hypothetical protein